MRLVAHSGPTRCPKSRSQRTLPHAAYPRNDARHVTWCITGFSLCFPGRVRLYAATPKPVITLPRRSRAFEVRSITNSYVHRHYNSLSDTEPFSLSRLACLLPRKPHQGSSNMEKEDRNSCYPCGLPFHSPSLCVEHFLAPFGWQPTWHGKHTRPVVKAESPSAVEFWPGLCFGPFRSRQRPYHVSSMVRFYVFCV